MKIQKNISLKPYTSFGIDAKAAFFAGFTSLTELEELVDYTKSPLLILGGGSNLLFTQDFQGLVARNEIKGIQLIKEDEDSYYVNAAGGENWHRFVLYCLENNFFGLENLSLIPGNVGASPMQNIGAYGVEIKDVFDSLEAYHLTDKIIHRFEAKDCEFGYRESVFKNKFRNQFVILNVTFRLKKKSDLHIAYGAIEQELAKMHIKDITARSISEAIIRIRTSKLPDPAVLGNAGSFFKNPVISNQLFEKIHAQYPDMPGFALQNGQIKTAAGWLIEQCGWKGYRKGDAGCYEKQALVLVNYGKAKGKEINELAGSIIESVAKKFNIHLEREVNII